MPDLVEYKPGTTFPGVIGRTVDQSSPAWPRPLRAREGAPNVLFIVLDDTGFGQFGCYGAPIRTPNLDALAANGLRYINFHTTALCSPTRSCLLTGRNHHSNAMSCITEGATGYPGSNGTIPFIMPGAGPLPATHLSGAGSAEADRGWAAAWGTQGG
jgi:hypothetical protein